MEQGLGDFCRYYNARFGHPRRMIEIGSYRGESTRIFHRHFWSSLIICIDPWRPGKRFCNPEMDCGMGQAERDFDLACEHMGSMIVKLKMTSAEAAMCKAIRAMAPFDLVYIDGDHSLAGVDLDILEWLPMTRFAIGGHDFGRPESRYEGVTKAVEGRLGEPDRVFEDTSWLKKIE